METPKVGLTGIAALEQEYKDRLAAATEELARAREEHERALGEVIDQREAAEEALSQAYYLVTGDSPEWSNLFGHAQALEAIDEAQTALRKSLKAAEASLKQFEGVMPDEPKKYWPQTHEVEYMVGARMELDQRGKWIALDDYDKLALHAARLAVDAGRYRWLRDSGHQWQEFDTDIWHEFTDSAIDAAMLASIEVKP